MKNLINKIKKFFGLKKCNHEYSTTLEFGHFENEYGIKAYTYTKCIHCEQVKIYESHTFKRNEYNHQPPQKIKWGL